MFGRLISIARGDVSPNMQRNNQQRIQEAAQAESAAWEGEKSGNRVYRLRHDKSPDEATRPLRFIAVGCQGSGDKNQIAVAKLMNELCANPESKPDFVLILGDNVYDWGADTANDENINKCFDDIYLRPEFSYLHNLPFFLLLGNHDENFQKSFRAARKKENGIERGIHEVAHSYIDDQKYDFTTKKYLYDHAVFHLSDMPSYNMPRRYYSLIAGEVQIFCVDSSTYVKEYLQLLTHPDTMNADNNQAAWLAEEITKARAAGRKVVLAQHHGLYTPGKRAFYNDLSQYLSEMEIATLPNKIPVHINNGTSYNYILKECLRQQQLEFDVVLAAHDHNLFYYNNKNNPKTNYNICQITAGGGGGKLQHRAKFAEQTDMGFFLSKTGVAVVSHTPKADDFDFYIHTADHQDALEFNSRSPQAVVHYDDNNPETEDIKAFFAVVRKAVNKYLQYMATNLNLLHGKDGAERAHKIWAYTNHPYPKSFREIIRDIHRIAEWDKQISTPDDYSLITILDKKLVKKYQKTMWDFAHPGQREVKQFESDIEMRLF